MKITNKDLLHQFLPVLSALGELETPFKVSYNIGRTEARALSITKVYRKDWKKLEDHYLERSGDGTVEVTKRGKLIFKSDNEKVQKEYYNKLEELHEYENDLQVNQVKLSEVIGVKGLTGNILGGLLEIKEKKKIIKEGMIRMDVKEKKLDELFARLEREKKKDE